MKKAMLCILLSIIALICCGCMSKVALNEVQETTAPEHVVSFIPENTPMPEPTRLNVGILGGSEVLFEYADELMNAASTYVNNADGSYALNSSVVEKLDIADTEQGKSYTFTLREDLLWSDESRVTANDYALGILYDELSGDALLGYEEYKNSKQPYFSGIRIHDENTLELIVSKAYCGDFFAAEYVKISPKKSTDSLMALDDGYGAYLSGIGEPMDVSCGPYMLFEADENSALLIRNDGFPGESGYYDEILLKLTDDDPASLIAKGEIDICPDQGAQETIDGVLELNYPASYYEALFFRCDEGVLSDGNIRKAVAHLADMTQYDLISGDYSKAQWQYKESGALPEPYGFDILKANELLDMSAYAFEDDGRTAFDPAKAGGEENYLRCDEDGNPLEITFLIPENNAYAKDIANELSQNAKLSGLSVSFEYTDEESLANEYFYGKEHDGYFLCMDVGTFDDKYYSFYGGYSGTVFNPMGIDDPDLNVILESMKACKDKAEYLKLWYEFQVRFSDICPAAFMRCGQESCLISDKLMTGEISPYRSWAQGVAEIRPKE